jgi:MFS family permease
VKQQGRYARLAGRRPVVAAALIGIPAGAAICVTLLALGDHFAYTRNWAGVAAVAGGFVLLMLASDLAGRRGSRLREARTTLTAVAVVALALGGLYWITGCHWGGPATFAAGAAYWTLLALAWRGAYLTRRRLRWRKHGYSPEARQREKEAYALWPRREARR